MNKTKKYMKKILLTFVALAAVLTGCKQTVFPERPSENGTLTLDLSCGENEYVVKSDDQSVDMSDFIVTINKLQDELGQESEWTKSWAYSEFPESLELAPGKFIISARNPEEAVVGWDMPKYYGEAEFTIVEGVVTPVELICSLANMKVSIHLTDNFVGEMSDYVITVTADYESGRQTLQWTESDFVTSKECSKAGYFDVAKLTVKITGHRAVDGSAPLPVTYEIKDVAARDHHIINIDAVVTGTASILQLQVDATVNDRYQDVEFGGIPEVPVPDEEEEQPGEQKPEKPYMSWASNPSFEVINIADIVAGKKDANLTIYAAGGIKALDVYVSENFQEIIMGLTSPDKNVPYMDLVNNAYLKEQLVTFGVTSLPMLDQVKDKTEVPFYLTDLVTLIQQVGFPEGDYVFTLKLEDNFGQKYEVSLTFYNPAV